ncbi:MAG: hypothetical protein AAB551_02910 [Patescibacteria group bacterium]
MKNKILTLVLAFTLALPLIAGAQYQIAKPTTLPGQEFNFATDADKQNAKNYLPNVIAPHFTKIFITFAGILAFFGLLVSGVLYIMAYGEEGTITKAKTIAQWSLIGLLISIFSYAIVSIVTSIKIL